MNKSCTVQALAVALFLLPTLAVSAPAAGQGAPQQAPKTVSWYANHQQERALRQLACMDNPGQLARDPDCINAHQASVEVALRIARARTGTLDPRDPAFWSADPNTRAAKLSMCRLNPQLDGCDAARRSLLIEAGNAKR
ncbi:EexN family lipoprotein [Phenylobacterium sp. LjRoot225]|uniref:EexN family lipoprotein n=1 Tax=Phenylobacterium sp. LjRoot225 TaxID=3342285 RepID=UPI003ED0BA1A